jgi:diguanylate cyclase (GGDEF)-like protein/PAS domain S-box-containing protein
MRRIAILLIIFSLFTGVSAKALKFGGDMAYPPFEFLDERGNSVGFNVDILNAIAEALGIEIEIELRTWTNVRSLLEKGEIDGLLGMYYSEERLLSVDFSVPHLIVHGSVFTRKTDGKFLSPDRLKEKTVAVQKGDIMDDYATANNIAGTLVRVDYPAIALEMLSSGQVDAVLLGSIQGLYLIDRLKLKNLVMSDNPFIRLEYCFAVRKGDQELLGILNEGLSLIMASGKYRQIHTKWFKSYSVESSTSLSQILTTYVLPVAIISAVALLLLNFWNVSLRKQVREKTLSLESELRIRSEIELALSASINRYKSMSGILYEYYYEIELEESGSIKDVWKSDAFEKITGYKDAEACSFEFWESIIYADDLKNYREHLLNLKSGRFSTTEYRILAKEGQLKWIRERSRPISSFDNGNLKSFYGASIDITEERQAKNALEETKEKVSRLHDVALRMEKTTDEETVYHSIIDASKNILRLDGFAFYLAYDQEVLPLEIGGEVSCVQGYVLRSGLLRDSIDSGESSFVDIQSIKKIVSDCEKSVLIVPIKNVGALISCHSDRAEQEEIKLVETLMAHATEAIRRIRSDNEIHYITFHDPLTNLYNRAYFEEEARRLSGSRQLPVSIILGDVNGLKLVNDAFGHLEGDRLLRAVADTIKSVVRTEDMVARWGGDEFVILLQQTDMQTCEFLIQRLKGALSKVDGFSLPLSVSFGMATRTKIGEDLRDMLVIAEEKMYRSKLLESTNGRSQAIELLEKNLLNKSFETREHTERVKQMAKMFAERLILPDNQVDNLLLLSALHDIGKIAVPEDILTKAGSLTSEEWKKIKSHPEAGYRIALSSPSLAIIADDILCHHEWWNGAGYPRGLKGEDIPLLSRIISIIDAFDVMTSERPYRKTLTVQEAIQELRIFSGKQFDPKLVETFIDMISNPAS